MSSQDLIDKKADLIRTLGQDISLFERDINIQHNFYDIWGPLRNQILVLFRRCKVDWGNMIKSLDAFFITFDPHQPWYYETKSNGIVFNILSLLYSAPYQVAGGLLHETNHAEYLRRHEMIKRPENIQDEFKKKHNLEIEITAYQKQIDFLECTKTHVPKEIHIYVTNARYGIYKIEEDITSCNDMLGELRRMKPDADNYDSLGETASINNYKKAMGSLGLDTSIRPREYYASARFNFQ